ncbi:Lysine-specific demethylase PHF2 [Varanus komodoensis]|nr:Lysine-specific demethylase PHF2 [Varanus komodoensis]
MAIPLGDDLCWERERQSATLLILLDLAAAFNSINHGVLLEGLAVGSTALWWFHSYLAECFQEDYMKLLGEVIWRYGLIDYTQLYLSFSSDPGEAVTILNPGLTWVMNGMRAHKLRLSPERWSCVGVEEEEAPDIDIYHCPNCEKTHGKST